MISATVKQLKDELSTHSQKELVELCLDLAKFKKENKELLTYLLYEASEEEAFVAGVKLEMEIQFGEINKKSTYLIKKSVRKILRITKKYIRYSKKKETDISLRIHFCSLLCSFKPSVFSSKSMTKLYDREIASVKKVIDSLHEDLQYDYLNELELIEKCSSE
jgi:hypothetical protein